MDPKTCLMRLISDVISSDFSGAVSALNDYYKWRLGQGLEPRFSRWELGEFPGGWPTHWSQTPHGDEIADLLANRLADALESED